MDQPEREEAEKAINEALDAVKEHAGALSGITAGGLATGFLKRRARRAFGGRRRRRQLLRRFGFGLLIAVSSVATCSFGVDPSTLTADYGDPVPATTTDAARVLTRGSERIRQAPESGAIRLTMTEEEATSALAVGLMLPELMRAAEGIPQEEIQNAPDLEALRERVWAEADAQREAMMENAGFLEGLLIRLDPKIRSGDVQVRFEANGEVVVAGFIQAWWFRQPGLFVFSPRAADGELSLDFVNGRLGRLPLPEFAFDWMGGAAVRALQLGRDYAEIREITVGDGTLTFEGRLTGS